MPLKVRIPRPRVEPGSLGIQVVGLLVIAGYVVLLQLAASRPGYDALGALVFIPALVLVSVPLLTWAGRLDADPRFLRLLVAAFVFKGIATAARYFMSMVFYGGNADASGYHGQGARLAVSYRQGDFSADLATDFIGTGFVRALTGVTYAVTGPSLYVGYAVFGWLSFWGLYFFYRAFQTAIPDGDHRRYALLVFFLPSLVFWPSGIGKESWMLLGIGLTAFGAAKLMVGSWGWVLPLAAGLGATSLVRPHVTALLATAIAAGLVLRRSLRQTSILAPIWRVIVTLVAVGVTVMLATLAASFLNVEGLSGEALSSATDRAEGATSQGGSEFDAVAVTSPLEFPWALVTVLFRPFLFEVNSAQMLLASLESVFLIVLAVRAIPRLRGLGARLRVQSYLIVCLVYTALFVYAFSYIGNFGLLARQRVQVLPFLLVFLALPLVRGREEPQPDEAETKESAVARKTVSP
jgi:hypothetical protein